MFGKLPDEVRRITGEFAELASTSQYWSGSNDRSSMGERIEEIVDCDSGSHLIGIAQDWQELAPGIMARLEQGNPMVRIHRGACPVRVRLNSYRTYESYTDWEHSSSSSSDRWVRYEAE